MQELRDAFRKHRDDIACAVLMESGCDALLDLRALFRVDANDDAQQVFTLLEELQPNIPCIYVQTNPGCDLRVWPKEQQIESVLGVPVKNAIWDPKDVNT